MEAKEICLKVDGLELVGELYSPPSASRLHPALCICHGIPATPHDPTDKGYAILAQRFSNAGFVTLIFNFRGAGKSEGNLDILGWSRDLKAAIDFLYNLEEVDKTHLCLLGFSGGAAMSIYVAAHDPRIFSVAACACPADFGFLNSEDKSSSALSTIQRFRQIGVIRDKDFPPSLEDWQNGFEVTSPIRWVEKISPRLLLLVHGDADEVVPVEHVHMLYQKSKEPKEIAVIPGAKHKLRLEEEAVVLVLDWLKAKCQN